MKDFGLCVEVGGINDFGFVCDFMAEPLSWTFAATPWRALFAVSVLRSGPRAVTTLCLEVFFLIWCLSFFNCFFYFYCLVAFFL